MFWIDCLFKRLSLEMWRKERDLLREKDQRGKFCELFTLTFSSSSVRSSFLCSFSFVFSSPHHHLSLPDLFSSLSSLSLSFIFNPTNRSLLYTIRNVQVSDKFRSQIFPCLHLAEVLEKGSWSLSLHLFLFFPPFQKKPSNSLHLEWLEMICG